MIGLDLLGASSIPAGRPVTVGAAVEDVIQKSYYAMSVNNATHSMESAYSVLQNAIETAKGGWFEKNLGAKQTLQNKMQQIADFAATLRADRDQGRAVTRAEWDKVRNFIRMSLSEWAGVNEGRQYQNRVFDQFIEEVDITNPANLAKGAGKLAWWILPWWAWPTGAAALGVAGFVGYKIYVKPLIK